MSFRTLLESLLHTIPTSRGILLMDAEGLSVDFVAPSGDDIEALGAEYTTFLKELRLAAEEMNLGAPRYVGILTDRSLLSFSFLDKEYLVSLVTDPRAGVGRSRWALATARPGFAAEL